MEPRSIPELFDQVTSARSDRTAYLDKRDGRWVDVSWAEQRRVVDLVGRALLALGVERGDGVGILAQTCLQWVQADFGIVNCGGVTVGIYPSNLAADCAYIVDHSEAVLIFVENGDQLEKILSVRSELPRLREVVVFKGVSEPDRGVLGWNDFLARGDAIDMAQLDKRRRELGPEDIASLVYTSGTTGKPKAAIISHDNLLFTTWSVGQCLRMQDDFITLQFLPLAHVYARVMVYCCMRGAVTSAIAEDLTTIPENLLEIRPHFVVSVPRVYEKVYQKILLGVEGASPLRRKVFHWCIDVGRRVSRLQLAGRSLPVGLRLRRRLAHRLVFRKIQAIFGGRLVYGVSGAAPLNQALGEFYHAVGVTLLEGIGMTENTSFSNVNRLEHIKFGTVGPAGPGVEVRIAPDGEILFRGKNVMQGYFKEPDATAAAIDGDGWLHSGDIGEIDDEGFLRITDRKKDLIITSGGKNIAPQRIERVLRASTYISQVMAYGDRRKYITALVTLNVEAVAEWMRRRGREAGDPQSLAEDPDVLTLIDNEIQDRNRELASFETVKKFRIVARDFSVEAGELTPTLKLRRKAVIERYAPLLESMYDDA